MVYKCKMCGGSLEITDGSTTYECEYCGTNQTVPVIDNEKKLNLFNRANRLRMASEFDKAATVYENIVSEFPEEAEGYWGLCLCKYGIEYVDDPATRKKIPTCHRTLYESIFDDNDFDMACEYADSYSKRLYRDEAKEIDRLQRAVLDIVKKEKPYDVFICYKETDESGQRTKDSVMAQDIYDALIAKGYKVFFARITLEDKLGQEYEPYIFAALTSAKVMLAVGTDYEYFNAVWVKNEWSRFLALMKKDKGKTLIPCYADIDAYDMPQEFKNLQAQDMNKIGFIQDLVRGVSKLIPLEGDKTQPVHQIENVVRSVNIENLIKRGNMALDDGEYDKAKEYFDRVLDEDAECAEAYWGIFLANNKCPYNNITNFSSEFRKAIFSKDKDLVKAIQYSNNIFRAYLSDFFEKLVKYYENDAEKARENAYKRCLEYVEIGFLTDEIKAVIKNLNGYKDSDTFISRAEENKRRIETEYAAEERRIIEENADKEKRNTEIKQLNERLAELNSLLPQNIDNKNICEKCSEDINFFLANKSETEKQLSEKEQKTKALNDELASLGIFSGRRKKEIESELSTFSSEIHKLSYDIEVIDSKISKLESEIDSHKGLSDEEINTIQSEIVQINARLAELQ